MIGAGRDAARRLRPGRGRARGTSRAGRSSAPRSRGEENSGTRHSDTLDETLQYFAVPIVHAERAGRRAARHVPDVVRRRAHPPHVARAGRGGCDRPRRRVPGEPAPRPPGHEAARRARAGRGPARASGDLEARAPVPDSPPEIRALAESFNRTAARLEELVTSQQAFVADASHQLRTPLAALRLRLENLEGELAGRRRSRARGRRAARSTEVARLSRLVDGLLELARAERSDGAHRCPIELGPVVDGRVDAWSALAAERDVDLVGRPRRRARRAAPRRAGSSRCSTTSSRNALEVAPAGERGAGHRPTAPPTGSSSCRRATRARG